MNKRIINPTFKVLVALTLAVVLLAQTASAANWGSMGALISWFFYFITKILGLLVLAIFGIIKVMLDFFVYFLAMNPVIVDMSSSLGPGCTPSPSIVKIMGYFLMLLYPFWIVAITFNLAYFIFATLTPAKRVKAKNILQRLIMGMIFASVSPYVIQLFLLIEQGMLFMIIGATFTPPCSVVTGPITGALTYQVDPFYIMLTKDTAQLHGWAIYGYWVLTTWLLIFLLLATFVALFRYLAVLFIAVLFPFVIFLYSLETTRQLGRELMKLSLTWIFVPVLQAVLLAIGVSALTTLGGGSLVAIFLLFAMCGWMIMAPFILGGVFNAIGGVVSAVGMMVPGKWGLVLTAVGGLMQGKKASAIAASALKGGVSSQLGSMRSEAARVGMNKLGAKAMKTKPGKAIAKRAKNYHRGKANNAKAQAANYRTQAQSARASGNTARADSLDKKADRMDKKREKHVKSARAWDTAQSRMEKNSTWSLGSRSIDKQYQGKLSDVERERGEALKKARADNTDATTGRIRDPKKYRDDVAKVNDTFDNKRLATQKAHVDALANGGHTKKALRQQAQYHEEGTREVRANRNDELRGHAAARGGAGGGAAERRQIESRYDQKQQAVDQAFDRGRGQGPRVWQGDAANQKLDDYERGQPAPDATAATAAREAARDLDGNYGAPVPTPPPGTPPHHPGHMGGEAGMLSDQAATAYAAGDQANGDRLSDEAASKRQEAASKRAEADRLEGKTNMTPEERKALEAVGITNVGELAALDVSASQGDTNPLESTAQRINQKHQEADAADPIANISQDRLRELSSQAHQQTTRAPTSPKEENNIRRDRMDKKMDPDVRQSKSQNEFMMKERMAGAEHKSPTKYFANILEDEDEQQRGGGAE
ncbi:Uncharacterised protein [uncultured archaeon]|nr:Uncharacterised protein [uncultured archaeon]